MARHLTATEASRGFAHLLDEVERRGEEFVIERHGRPVAVVAPTGPPPITWGDALARLREGPQPDSDFAADLEAIRREEPPLPTEDPWERYSTPPS
ncbi:MAG TPA: type II toxin-antitoxin system prevent-host-death family antitoxin [Candidatus Dormibacteraeota bacterium]|jgi:prevent-host-death family protein|nr:type II toxin-antitoxin system prevent-host-death family antitoxin [Candidatus Dormibacteraeota bacterium]